MKIEVNRRMEIVLPDRYVRALDKAAKKDLSSRSVQVRQAIQKHLILKGISVDEYRPS